MKMTDNFWKSYGLALQWLGAVYFMGFFLFGAFLVVIYPKIAYSLQTAGQSSFLGVGQNIVLPLLVFFMVVSGATWYEGKELRESEDLNLFDKVVAVSVLVVLVVFATPQLVEAFTSLIPLFRG
jgi:hypothetical protein